MKKNNKIKKGLVALLLAAQIGFIGCNGSGGVEINHQKSYFKGREDLISTYYFPKKEVLYNINNYGNDDTIDEIVVHKDGLMKVYVNKEAKGKYPDADRFRETWYDKEREEVDNKCIDQLANKIMYEAKTKSEK